MLTNVQVLAGATVVARFDDVVLWFETGPDGGGQKLAQVLETVRAVSSGSVATPLLGARLAEVLNAGDAQAVPALVAATPEEGGLRVVVHGWGAVVADGVHHPNGWVDEVITDRHTFFLGRNTVAPAPPDDRSPLDLEEGIVPGDGVSFALAPATPAHQAEAAEPPAYEPPPSDPPAAAAPPPAPAAVAWPPPGAGPAAAGAPSPQGPQPGSAPAPLPPGRLVLDDGSSAPLERTCVLGSAPHNSPAVQTAVAIPLTVMGPGVAPVHVEIRVESDGVAARDLGGATTYVLAPGAASWTALAPGQTSPLVPGTRIAIGQRTISYERP